MLLWYLFSLLFFKSFPAIKSVEKNWIYFRLYHFFINIKIISICIIVFENISDRLGVIFECSALAEMTHSDVMFFRILQCVDHFFDKSRMPPIIIRGPHKIFSLAFLKYIPEVINKPAICLLSNIADSVVFFGKFLTNFLRIVR